MRRSKTFLLCLLLQDCPLSSSSLQRRKKLLGDDKTEIVLHHSETRTARVHKWAAMGERSAIDYEGALITSRAFWRGAREQEPLRKDGRSACGWTNLERCIILYCRKRAEGGKENSKGTGHVYRVKKNPFPVVANALAETHQRVDNEFDWSIFLNGTSEVNTSSLKYW